MRLFLLPTCFFVFISSLFAQPDAKKGISFGALPAVSFDSDLGFQYGALVNLYDYGNGKTFPAYNHSAYFELSSYTKGTSIFRFRYDSGKLIQAVRTTIDVSYVAENMADFYGFNGNQTLYSPELVESSNHLFYKNQRNMFRLKTDFQGALGHDHFGWLAGYSLYHFDIQPVDNVKLGIEKTGVTLFEKYREWGLIPKQDIHGGVLHYLKLGIKYDTRDEQASPSAGIYTEAMMQSALPVLNKRPHSKIALIHRQYHRMLKGLVFAYRLDCQATVGGGEVPYYAQPLLLTSYLIAATNQGMGGKTSLRGILRNRVVGDDVAFGNFEFRYKILHFEWLKQYFYLGTNLFFDTGMILKPMKMNLSSLSENDKATYFSTYQPGKLHSAYGAGLKIGWNENFVISTEYGRALDKQDGKSGFYVGLNYLF